MTKKVADYIRRFITFSSPEVLNQFGGNPQAAFNYAMSEYGNDPDWQTALDSALHMHGFSSFAQKLYNQWTMDQVANGNLGANDVYGDYAGKGLTVNEEGTKYLDNQIAQENTQADRDYQTEMRDTSLLSSGSQLQQLGLSPSNVISVGGANSGVTSSAASTSFAPGSANRKQQLAMNQYNQRMGMAKSLISMAGSMASSGIYGAAFGAAKHSASALAAAASHSGLMALKTGATSGEKYSTDQNGFLKFE